MLPCSTPGSKRRSPLTNGSLEDGEKGGSYYSSQKRRLMLFVLKKLKQLFLCCVFTIVAVCLWWGTVRKIADRESALLLVSKALQEDGGVCLAPMHIGYPLVWRDVVFSSKSAPVSADSEDPVVYLRSIELINLIGEVSLVPEKSSLCTSTAPKFVNRYERVAISYATNFATAVIDQAKVSIPIPAQTVEQIPLLQTRATIELHGPNAYCVQHMLELFDGHWPCEDHKVAKEL